MPDGQKPLAQTRGCRPGSLRTGYRGTIPTLGTPFTHPWHCHKAPPSTRTTRPAPRHSPHHPAAPSFPHCRHLWMWLQCAVRRGARCQTGPGQGAVQGPARIRAPQGKGRVHIRVQGAKGPWGLLGVYCTLAVMALISRNGLNSRNGHLALCSLKAKAERAIMTHLAINQ